MIFNKLNGFSRLLDRSVNIWFSKVKVRLAGIWKRKLFLKFSLLLIIATAILNIFLFSLFVSDKNQLYQERLASQHSQRITSLLTDFSARYQVYPKTSLIDYLNEQFERSDSAGDYSTIFFLSDLVDDRQLSFNSFAGLPKKILLDFQLEDNQKQLLPITFYTDSTNKYAYSSFKLINQEIKAVTKYDTFHLHTEQINFLERSILISVLLVGLLLLLTHIFFNRVFKTVTNLESVLQSYAKGDFKPLADPTMVSYLQPIVSGINAVGANEKIKNNRLDTISVIQRTFTSDVSHELRTPLTSIRLATDVINDSIKDKDNSLRRPAEILSQEVKRFEILLEDLLEISRFDTDTAVLHLQEINLRIPIMAAVTVVKPLYEKMGVNLIVDHPAKPIYASIDTIRIERVIRNLLSNAVDYALGNPVKLIYRENRAFFAISVIDTGVGLTAKEASLVFARFWRADPSRERVSGGTGLGLAISYEDVRLHGGKLEVISEKGKGTNFRLTIPKKPLGLPIYSPLPLTVSGD